MNPLGLDGPSPPRLLRSSTATRPGSVVAAAIGLFALCGPALIVLLLDSGSAADCAANSDSCRQGAGAAEIIAAVGIVAAVVAAVVVLGRPRLARPWAFGVLGAGAALMVGTSAVSISLVLLFA